MTHGPDCETARLVEDDEELKHVAVSMSSNDIIGAGAPPSRFQWRPFIILLVLNGMQPLGFEIIFPFVNQMIVEIGVVSDPERVGFYSGVIESIFACMSLATVLPLSVLADRIGRKPVILGGMLGLAISVVSFSLSKSLLAMVLSRCLGGALGGAWACIKIMLAEMTDKSTVTMAFSASSIAYRTGQIIGLPLGGILAHPEKRFPLFQSPLWYEYPYLLPCAVSGIICVCTVTVGYFFLPETLPSKRTRLAGQAKYGATSSATDNPRANSTARPNSEGDAQEVSTRQRYMSVMTPSIISLFCSNFAMCMVSQLVFSVFPLFAFTPISSGGLGMSEAEIGMLLGIRGLSSVVILAFYLPLQRRFGTVRVYQLAMWTWPVTTLCCPLLNLLARSDKRDESTFFVLLTIFVFVWSIAGFGWTALSVMVTDAAPSAATLATMNALSQITIILPQAIGPATITASFAASIRSGIAGGNLIWIILFVITTAAAIHSMTLREAGADWRQK